MKKLIKRILIGIVLFCCTVLSVLSSRELNRVENARSRLNTLPPLQLKSITGDIIDLRTLSNKTIMLVHVNTTCEHCQFEVKQIEKNIARFRNCIIVFLSSEPMEMMIPFAQEHEDLSASSTVYFTQVPFEMIADVFGVLVLPHIFIYGDDKRLRKELKGEAKMEVLLQYI